MTAKRREALERTINAELAIDWEELESDPMFGGSVPEGHCRLCNGKHEGVICPNVRSVQFYRDGQVKSVRLRGGGREMIGNNEEHQKLD